MLVKQVFETGVRLHRRVHSPAAGEINLLVPSIEIPVWKQKRIAKESVGQVRAVIPASHEGSRHCKREPWAGIGDQEISRVGRSAERSVSDQGRGRANWNVRKMWIECGRECVAYEGTLHYCVKVRVASSRREAVT